MLFANAITRKPGENFSQGITTANLGPPDYREALRQHGVYVETLRRCGLKVTVLEADPNFPDGCFVEDTAVVIPQVVVITNPGTESRNGETIFIAEVLKKFRPLQKLESPGTMDGGDVLRVEKQFFVGLSERTNEEGVRQFERIVQPFGYTIIPVPLSNLLHLKSGIGYIGNNTVVAVRELMNRREFVGITMIEIDQEEAYAANCLRVDDSKLLIPSGCPEIKDVLSRRGYNVTEMEMSEFRKMDGGLTCLSLLF